MPSLVDDVLASVRNSRRGNPTWFEKLPAKVQAELEAVRATFDPKIHQKRAFYLAIRAAAEKRGWQIARERQVTLWLTGER